MKQYILEKGEDYYYIGIENLSQLNYKLKLILEQLIVNNGPFKGQTTPIFELNPNERKVFELFVLDENPSIKFDLVN